MRCIFVALAAVALSVGVAAGAETSRSPQPLDGSILSLPTCPWGPGCKRGKLRSTPRLPARTATPRREIDWSRNWRPRWGRMRRRRSAGDLQEAGHDRLGEDASPRWRNSWRTRNFRTWRAMRLERIPDRAAAAALPDGAAADSGKTKIGIISSIAARQDAKAVDALVALLDDRDWRRGRRGTAALAEIGSPKSLDAVMAFPPKAPVELEDLAKDACLRAAERLLQAGRPEAAATVYQRLKADTAEPIRAACLRGLAPLGRSNLPAAPDGGPVGE